MCCSPHRFAVRTATHYHTRAWQTLIYEKECFILLLKAYFENINVSMKRYFFIYHLHAHIYHYN